MWRGAAAKKLAKRNCGENSQRIDGGENGIVINDGVAKRVAAKRRKQSENSISGEAWRGEMARKTAYGEKSAS